MLFICLTHSKVFSAFNCSVYFIYSISENKYPPSICQSRQSSDLIYQLRKGVFKSLYTTILNTSNFAVPIYRSLKNGLFPKDLWYLII